MHMILQLTLVVVLLVLCGFLVALLIQLRHTAAAVATLAESARADLNLIASDIHHLRTRADELADLAAQGMAMPAKVTGILSGFEKTVEAFLGRGVSPLADLLLMGLRMAMDWLLHRKPAPPAESAPM